MMAYSCLCIFFALILKTAKYFQKVYDLDHI